MLQELQFEFIFGTKSNRINCLTRTVFCNFFPGKRKLLRLFKLINKLKYIKRGSRMLFI